jgi:hypothetical protein
MPLYYPYALFDSVFLTAHSPPSATVRTNARQQRLYALVVSDSGVGALIYDVQQTQVCKNAGGALSCDTGN